MSLIFNALRIEKLIRETSQSVTIEFDIPHSLQSAYRHRAGQYVNLKLMLGGQEHRRAYSLSSSPLEDRFAISVKLVDGGVVSTHLCTVVKEGDYIDVSLPEGSFVLDWNESISRQIFLFAAGSGITPILAMLKTGLEREPKSQFYLMYGNREEDQIMFRSTLDQLVNLCAGQLVVTHILSQPAREKPKGLTSLFTKGKHTWEGLIGRVIPENVSTFFHKSRRDHLPVEIVLCGPGNMIDQLSNYFIQNDISKSNIHREYFTVADRDDENKLPHQKGIVTVHLDQKKITTSIDDKTILFTLLDDGHEPPYSCTNGTCSACMAKVVGGQISMDQCFALDDDEIEEGYILTCQSRLQSPDAEITYDI